MSWKITPKGAVLKLGSTSKVTNKFHTLGLHMLLFTKERKPLCPLRKLRGGCLSE